VKRLIHRTVRVRLATAAILGVVGIAAAWCVAEFVYWLCASPLEELLEFRRPEELNARNVRFSCGASTLFVIAGMWRLIRRSPDPKHGGWPALLAVGITASVLATVAHFFFFCGAAHEFRYTTLGNPRALVDRAALTIPAAGILAVVAAPICVQFLSQIRVLARAWMLQRSSTEGFGY